MHCVTSISIPNAERASTVEHSGLTLMPNRSHENMQGGQFLLVGMALFLFDTFSIAPLFATGASSVKVERNAAPAPLADTFASPSPNASTIVGTELTHNLDDGPAFLVCISAADLSSRRASSTTARARTRCRARTCPPRSAALASTASRLATPPSTRAPSAAVPRARAPGATR